MLSNIFVKSLIEFSMRLKIILNFCLKNSYEGWLKIRNVHGEEGIVPSAYVEYINYDVSIESTERYNLIFSFYTRFLK